jgi:hypothetical protein
MLMHVEMAIKYFFVFHGKLGKLPREGNRCRRKRTEPVAGEKGPSR